MAFWQWRGHQPSILGGLLIRVGLGLVLLMGLVGWVFWQTLDTVSDRAQDEMLRRQVDELLPNLRRDRKNDKITADLSAGLAETYRDAADGYLFAIHDGRGRIYVASQPNAGLLLQKALRGVQGPVFFDTAAEDGTEARYMLTRPLWLKPKPIYLTVGQYRTIDDVLLDQAGKQALAEMTLWLVPCLALGLLMVWASLSRGLAPLRDLSAAVRSMGAGHLDERLFLPDIPSEIKPLADSINVLREHLARVLASQRQLTADMAHQLKTPLAIMQARLELLAPLPGRDDLLRDVQRLARLIQQMLHFSQLLEQDTALQPMDLRQIVPDVVGRLAPLADKAGVTLRYQAPAGETAMMVRGDSLMLAEALQNLVDNAIQHSPPGEAVDVVLTAEGTLEVRDRGPGIPALEKGLVFSRFWRSDDAAEDGGSGLGLAIVAEVVRHHGGRLWVADRDGGGSVFGVALPRLG